MKTLITLIGRSTSAAPAAAEAPKPAPSEASCVLPPSRTQVYIDKCLRELAPPSTLPPSRPADDVVAGALPRVSEGVGAVHAALPAIKPASVGWRIRAAIKHWSGSFVARSIYLPAFTAAKAASERAVHILAKKAGVEPTEWNRKWHALMALHETGHFGGAFGHEVNDGAVEVQSKLVASRATVQRLETQAHVIGRDLVLPDGTLVAVKKPEVHLMLGVSGMSYPQLSAPAVLALVYANVRMAKDGVRYLVNTGEGGPDLHLAFLSGDRTELKREVVAWGQKTGQLKGKNQAEVELYIDELMRERDALFKDLSAEDIAKAQIVAQFGTALNGVRGEGCTVDFAKLSAIGKNPHVAMIEYKLKQAAKRGSRVDASKMGPIPAAVREVDTGSRFKSPEVNPDMDSYEDIARLVVATKLATHKPVSLKFAVGDIENIGEFLEYLARMDALPDNIQLDGGGKFVSPGSGNAPTTGAAGNTSRVVRDSVIAVDTILRRLGVRDEVHLTAAGEVMLPTDALEVMALGADGVVGARTWMGMGLGCINAMQCDNGSCPRGIAAKHGSVFENSMKAQEVGTRAYEAASEWRKHLLISMSETGAMDWRAFRKTHGLHARKVTLTVRHDGEQVSLQRHYGPERKRELYEAMPLSQEELQQLADEARTSREYSAYETFDVTRRLLHYLDGLLSTDETKAMSVQAYREQRLAELEEFMRTPRSAIELRDFIHRALPPELCVTGMRALRTDAPPAPPFRHPQLQLVPTDDRAPATSPLDSY